MQTQLIYFGENEDTVTTQARPVYINRIKPFMNKSIVKVLTGHRRVGKSYILFQLMDIIKNEYTDANIIYVNKEDIRFDNIRDYTDLHSYIAEKANPIKVYFY